LLETGTATSGFYLRIAIGLAYLKTACKELGLAGLNDCGRQKKRTKTSGKREALPIGMNY